MALIEIIREANLAPRDSWRRLTDWEQHGRFVPLTRISRTGDGFVARTGLGPVGFDDPMEVVEWREPSFCRLEKRGHLVTGWAELVVEPLGTGSRVTWREDIHVRGVPHALDGLTRVAGRRMFARVVDGLLA